jgi:hypothetical protein
VATHGSLRTDAFDPDSIQDGDWEAVRECLRRIKLVHDASTFSFATDGDDTIYGDVITQQVTGTDILYRGNPDDPANPIELVIVPTGTAAVIWQDEGSTVATYDKANFVGSGVVVTDDAANNRVQITITAGNVTVQEEGTPLTARAIINFIGPTVTAVDDAGNSRTNVTITGYDTIADEGSTFTKRQVLNFQGAVSVSDNVGTGFTDVLINAPFIIAMLTGNTPAITAMNGTLKTATPGMSTGTATLMEFSGDNLVAQQEDLGAGPVDAVRNVMNLTETALRASATDPILAIGYITENSGGDRFVYVGPFDHRILPGFDPAADPPQVPYQDTDGYAFTLDSEACPA